MNTITTPRPDEDLDPYEEEPTEQLPRRRRRQWLTWRSAALGALVTCAVGFYVGIRVEKGQVTSSGTTTGAARLSSRASGTTGARAGLAALFAGAGRTGGAAGGAAGAAGAAGGGSFGTVASVSGRTLYVTEASGNTVKVRLSSATKVSKTQSVSRSAIHPGDTVVVQGVSGSGGTVSAASVTDSGARGVGALGAGGGSGGSAGSGRGGTSSAVGSLFSSGG